MTSIWIWNKIMDEILLYNKRLGITEKDVMETEDLELLSRWKADLTFQSYWLKVPCEDEEERKRQAWLQIRLSKFSALVYKRILMVKNRMREEAGIPHVSKKEIKKRHLLASKFMASARLLLPDDVFTSILEEARKRREQADEAARRFVEETNCSRADDGQNLP